MPNRKAIHNTLGHVVVVDDDPSVRQSVHTLLKREGYRVSVYDSADAFLQNIHQPFCSQMSVCPA
jgi:FixJ family two-component response regulator